MYYAYLMKEFYEGISQVFSLYLHQIMFKVTEADDINIQVNIFVGRNICENYLQHDFHDRYLKAFTVIPFSL